MESYQISGALHLRLSILEDGGGDRRTTGNQANIFTNSNSENLSTQEAVKGKLMDKWKQCDEKMGMQDMKMINLSRQVGSDCWVVCAQT